MAKKREKRETERKKDRERIDGKKEGRRRNARMDGAITTLATDPTPAGR